MTNEHGKSDRDATVLYNRNRIQQVLDIEKQAQATQDAAAHEADQYPLRAEQDAQALIDKAKASAQEEAKNLVANAGSEEECARILAQANADVQHMQARAMSHFDRAVNFVLDRVAGRE